MAIGVNIFKKDLLTGKVRINHFVEEKENEQRYTSNFTRT
jgi:hypothetical protein